MKKKIMRRTCLLLALLLIVSLLPGCKKKDKLPEGAYYVIKVEKSDGKKTPYTLTLIYDQAGNLLRCQDDDEREDYTYDAQGNKLTYRGYHPTSDVLVEAIDYTYDEAGRLIKEEGYRGTDEHHFCNTYQYDENGTLIHHKQYHQGKLIDEWRYDSEGMLWERINHRSVFTQRYTYTYTFDGKLLTVRCDDSREDVLDQTIEYTYGKYGKTSGKLLSKKSSEGSIPREEITYSYDDIGRLVQKVCKESVYEETFQYVYAQSGELLSCTLQVRYRNGEWAYGRYREYDERGRLIKENGMNADGELHPPMVWSYDAAGNVTKIEYNSGNQQSVYEFTYTWPERELHPAVRESVAEYVAQMAFLDGSSPEDMLQLE